jgi:hypothetical protein
MSALDRKLAALEDLPLAQLRARAAVDLGAVPAGFGPDLLRLGIAYALQERGGQCLPPSVAREIAAALDGRAGKRSAAPLRPGTQLVREWQGRTHVVEAVGDGFLYRDRSFRSLSAIAREITGTAWSGPRFFGLTKSEPRES